MKNPVETFLAVDAVGGRLGVVGVKLRMLLPHDCPPELKMAIRQHKPALIELLHLNFLVVRSDTLSNILFWTADDATKESLAAAGADRGNIYTTSELEQLVNHRVTFCQIPQIHAAKQRFDGKLTE